MTPTDREKVNEYRPKYISDRCRYCREFHGSEDINICQAISELEAKDAEKKALEGEVARLKAKDYADYIHVSEHTALIAENAKLKEEVANLRRGEVADHLQKAELCSENHQLALQLAAVRDILKKIKKLEDDREYAPSSNLFREASYLVEEALSTPPPTLVAQMEKKMEAAKEALEAVERNFEPTQPYDRQRRTIQMVKEALTLWNTANERKDNA